MIRRAYVEAGGLLLGTAVIVLLAFSAGADPNQTSITGMVYYDGQPIDIGTISFTPTHSGVTAGGAITDGRYSVANVSRGSNRVVITAEWRPTERLTYEVYMEKEKLKDKAMAEMWRLRSEGVKDRKVIDAAVRKIAKMPEPRLPEGVVGNNQIVDISPDVQSLDFKLLSPGEKK